MTIAVCYLSPEGIVLGADSTSTYGANLQPHFYNNAQKLFEIGENSTLGVVTWGLGGLHTDSYRTLLARLGDSLASNKAQTVFEVAERWVDIFWLSYSSNTSPLAPLFAQCKALAAKSAFASAPAGPNVRSEAEENEFANLSQTLVVGFCLGGYMQQRQADAYEIVFDPLAPKPSPIQLGLGCRFWGAPNMIQRLILGCDDSIRNAIVSSGKWSGTIGELDALVFGHVLHHPIVPIRDAIDFVHTCVLRTPAKVIESV